MRNIRLIMLLIVLTTAHVLSLGKVAEGWKLLPKGGDSGFVMPGRIMKITALEFDGLASDFLFLKSLVFIGSTHERTQRPRVKAWEWKWLYGVVEASAKLDPYFLDPYYFANANFTWEALMIQETNSLLDRGSRYRTWDSMLPFFIGFNYFYFLQDHVNASTYLLEAAGRPGESSSFYAGLAAKLAYERKRNENAISFLEEMIKRTDDELLRKRYMDRVSFLRGVVGVEKAIELYKKKFGRKPDSMKSLFQTGMLREIPVDPSGGRLYLDTEGRVKSTSEQKMDLLRK